MASPVPVDPAPVPLTSARPAHYPALDGMRGLSLLLVFAGHYVPMTYPGTALSWAPWFGVDLFFVLSGFLITGILFDSLPRPRYFRNFYTRRALRIFPLYYSVWLLFLLLTPWLHPLWTRFDIGRVFYVVNLMTFSAARHPELTPSGFMFHLPNGHLTGFNAGPVWSLCLEEQFYLLWPLILFRVRDRRRLMRLCAVGILASPLLNGLLFLWASRTGADRSFLYNATYCHFSPMLFGAWLALWLRGRSTAPHVSPRVYWTLILAPCCILGATILFLLRGFDHLHPAIFTYGYLCSGLLGSGLLLAAIQPGTLVHRLFSRRWLMAVGTISYGLYIIHGYLMGAFSHHAPTFQRHHLGLLLPVVAFAVTWLLATLSYRFLESPFLRLKDRFAPSTAAHLAAADAAMAADHRDTAATPAETGLAYSTNMQSP